MTLFCTKKLRAVSFISGMEHPVISVSFFYRLLEPVFFLPISLSCLSI